MRTCVIRDLYSPAGIIIIWQEDVAYCQEQILFGHLGHCQRLGRVGGEEGPWLQGGREHVGQENNPGPEPVPRRGPSSHCDPLRAQAGPHPSGNEAEAAGGRML